jgi:hypothetical protein
MPNWCVDRLTVRGTKAELEKFRLVAAPAGKDSKLDFNCFIPYPEEYAKQDRLVAKMRKEAKTQEERAAAYSIKDGYNSGGYDWRSQSWGTKWNAGDVELTQFKTTLRYDFETAWAPPKPVVMKMSQMFPKLEFSLRYWERGCEFQGVYTCKGGHILNDETSDYHGEKGG